MPATENFRKSAHILLVDDDPGDVEMTKESLLKNNISVNLQVADNGEAAIKYLRRQGKFAHAVQPNLILLDLNLPRKDGREVLHEIRSDEELKHIPVIVLTTSEANEDILKSYDLGANCYITKPIGLNEFLNAVKSIKDFWLNIVKLPTR